jgi:hypothetical protein
LEVITTSGTRFARIVPSSGIETWKSERTSRSRPSNSSSARSIQGAQQRATQQEPLAEDLPLDRGRRIALVQPDREQLTRVVPLVECRSGVQPLEALESQELLARRGGEGLRDLGLAAPRFALDEERLTQLPREVHGHRQLGIGDVPLAGQEFDHLGGSRPGRGRTRSVGHEGS